MSNILKNNFFTRALKGEGKFWKVFLVGVFVMLSLLYLKSQWQALMPFVLISAIYPLVLIPMNRYRNNVNFLKNKFFLKHVINLIVVVLWIFYVLMFLFSIFVFLVFWIGCTVNNNQFCVSFF